MLLGPDVQRPRPIRYPGARGEGPTVKFRFLLTSLLLLAGMGPGCGVIEIVQVDQEAATATCTCGAKQMCYQGRLCVAEEAVDTDVIVRLAPPKNSGLLVEEYKLTLRGGEHQKVPETLTLTEPAIVHGTLTRAGEGTQSIPGTLIATAIPDKEEQDASRLQYQAVSLQTPKKFAGAAEVAGFELRVQTGKTYELAFYPEADGELPPYYGAITVGGHIDGWKIELPGKAQVLRVQGRLVTGGQPLAGVRMFLLDEAGRLRSTRTLTSEDGKFLLLVDPTVQKGVVRFEPAQAAQPLPAGQLVGALDLGKIIKKGGPLELGDVDLGPLPAPIDVTLTVEDAAHQPVPGAFVRLRQEFKPMEEPTPRPGFAVEVHGYADAKGRFAARMLPGSAKTTVVPAPKSSSGRWKGVVELLAGKQPPPISCPKRPALSGSVVGPSQQAVEGARVVLWRVGKLAPGGAEVGSDEPFVAETDAKGAFSVGVDDGDYWLWVLPKEGAPLGRMLAQSVKVDVGQSTVLPAITLPPPVVLAGKVLTAKGAPVKGVSVEVLAIKGGAPPKNAGLDAPGSATGAKLDSHLLASDSTLDGGQFEVLVTLPQP